MGTRGPMPKRTGEHKGHISNAKLHGDHVTALPGTGDAILHKATPPAPDDDWSDDALRLWEAAIESTQSALYEATDWEMLYTALVDLTNYQGQTRRNSQMLAALAATFDDLMLTEGARRRLAVETDLIDNFEPWPEDAEWCGEAVALWRATCRSPGITQFYQPSDWAVLYFTLTELTQFRDSAVPSGQMRATLNSLFSNLMLTEGTRRRLDLELGALEPESTGLTPGEEEALRWLEKIGGLPTKAN